LYDRPRSLLLGVSGGIAAYKACDIARHFVKLGVSVQVVMTENATKFIGPTTFEALTDRPVFVELFKSKDLIGQEGTFRHIDLGKGFDAFLIAPATANVIAKFAAGIADDLLSSTYLCSDCPVLVAPAMNTRMWLHPATKRNVEILQGDGVEFVMPETGELACGEFGAGRLAPVCEIEAATERILGRGGSWSGIKALVTTGPTREAIDPVRFVSNNSTGHFGRLVARQLIHSGAEVTLIEGNTVEAAFALDCPRISVRSAEEMCRAVLDAANNSDIVFMMAAVADFTPAFPSARKIKKDDLAELKVEMKRTVDILSELGGLKKRPPLVGVSAETVDIVANSERKLKEKRLDAILAVDVGIGPFGEAPLSGALILADGLKSNFGPSPKEEIAKLLVDSVRGKVFRNSENNRPGGQDE
jgi:phosphopantothenoylcysteine decarboxylase/phosphopantothenate--cysteine ligase